MVTLLLSMAIIGLCFVGFGVGVLLFGKKPTKSECGTVPGSSHEECPSHLMGICPVEDTRKEMQHMHQTKITDR